MHFVVICLYASLDARSSTLSHNDRKFTCQSARHARYATMVGGRRLFPHNCSNAVEEASTVGTEDVAAGERRAGGGIVCV
jgi:hypothetical protein